MSDDEFNIVTKQELILSDMVKRLRVSKRECLDKIEKLEAENKELRERQNAILDYCEDYVDIMWAARIVSIILECDFRDSKAEVRKAREILKQESKE